MQTASQNETICFLGSSRAFGDCADCMEMVSTHISVVLLIGGRMGESEFALLLRMPAGQRRLTLSLDNARHLLCRPVSRGNMVIDFTISIGGAALEGNRRREPATLFAEAQAALHVASMAGGNTLRMFDRPPVNGTRSLPAS